MNIYSILIVGNDSYANEFTVEAENMIDACKKAHETMEKYQKLTIECLSVISIELLK